MLLEARGLCAGYAQAQILEDLSLAIEPGEALAVLGRNGVGKTTLMLAIMGHARITGGTLRWRDRDLAAVAPPDRVRAGIGWVPQERDIFASLTVEENLRVAARPGEIALATIYEIFPRLAERRRNKGDRLSGGEQQMLAIGRALIGNPALLLLDEPFEGLAPIIVEELEATVRRLRQRFGFAVVIVEQHAEDTLRLTDRAVVLDRGRVVLEDRSEALLADFGRVRRFIEVGGRA